MTTTAITRYPKYLTLRDGTTVTVRPMVREDVQKLLEFFKRLPEEDRFYLKDNVVSPDVVEGWARNLDYSRVLPLVAEEEGQILADATLHRRQGAAHRHKAEIRITVDPAVRGRGLGTALLHELMDYASHDGVEEVEVELVEGAQEDAMDAARRAGFVETARFPKHVKDMGGNPHDVVVMWTTLGKWYVWW